MISYSAFSIMYQPTIDLTWRLWCQSNHKNNWFDPSWVSNFVVVSA